MNIYLKVLRTKVSFSWNTIIFLLTIKLTNWQSPCRIASFKLMCLSDIKTFKSPSVETFLSDTIWGCFIITLRNEVSLLPLTSSCEEVLLIQLYLGPELSLESCSIIVVLSVSVSPWTGSVLEPSSLWSSSWRKLVKLSNLLSTTLIPSTQGKC